MLSEETELSEEGLAAKEMAVAQSSWRSEIYLTIHEGRFHQVKGMMEALGKKVIYLKRISMGALTLPDDLPKGVARELTVEEMERLKNA